MKNIYIYLIVILIILNIFLIISFKTKSIKYRYFDKNTELLENKLTNLTNEYETCFLFNIMLNNTLFPNIDVGNNWDLKKSIKINKLNIIFRFKEDQCEPCIAHSINLLRELIEHNNGVNIIIIADYGNMRKMMAFKNQFKDDVSVFNIKNISSEIDTIDKPFFAIVDKKMNITDVYVVVKNREDLTKKYVDMIVNKYIN